MPSKNQAESLEKWVGADQSAILDLGPKIEGVQVWGEQTNQAFRRTLLDWYDMEKRDLPWRRQRHPYAIWVSEIMLQQTQVDTVIPYYNHFMDKYPDIASLAAAKEDELLKAWEGLGYYSRVRNMQTAAQQIMADFKGEFPDNLPDIRSLKGIGPYTAGAIASIAFDEAVPAIDGNAMRVYARLFAIDADIAIAKNRVIFEAIGSYLIDPKRPGDFNQAIMDLGSSYCTAKNPQPLSSPVRAFNLSTFNGTTLKYPVKSKKQKAKPVYYQALMVENNRGQFLIEKRIHSKLLNNLWMVPMLELSGERVADANAAKQLNLWDVTEEDMGRLRPEINQGQDTASNKWPAMVAETEAVYRFQPIFLKREIGQVKHVFTHLVWHIQLYYARLRPADEQRIDEYIATEGSANFAWVYLHELDNYAFPTVQKKIWETFQLALKNKLIK